MIDFDSLSFLLLDVLTTYEVTSTFEQNKQSLFGFRTWEWRKKWETGERERVANGGSGEFSALLWGAQAGFEHPQMSSVGGV